MELTIRMHMNHLRDRRARAGKLNQGHEAKSHFTSSLPRLHRPWWDTVEDMLLNTLIALGKQVRARRLPPFVGNQIVSREVHRSDCVDYTSN